MILVGNDNTEFELDRLWIPEHLFSTEKNAGLERNEQNLETYLIGDQGTIPKWIHLRSRRHFDTGLAREVYLSDLNGILNNISKLVYEDIEIYLNFGYYFVTTRENILDVEINVKLSTTISDLKNIVRGTITMGRTDIYMGQTDITLSD